VTLIEPPVTALTLDVAGLLADSDPVVVAHSRRSHQFAAMAARADGVELDDEVLYVGTVLHDIGLAPRCDGSERFEVRGANMVRALLLDHGVERERAEAVWDVIALHASTPLARHKSPETRYANRGIPIDIRGVGAESIPPASVRAVLDRWPRDDFAGGFTSVLVEEVRAHADTVRFSWLESIAERALPGFRRDDFLAAMEASAGFR